MDAIAVVVLAVVAYSMFKADRDVLGWTASAAAFVVAIARPFGSEDEEDEGETSVAEPEQQPKVEVQMPVPPTTPGCYMYTASGCPKQKFTPSPDAWRRDVWGEKNRGAGESESKCAQRAKSYNSWCGATDYKHHFNPAK